MLQTVLFVERQVIGWFEILQKGCCQKESFPVGIVSGEIGDFYYFPEFEEPGMKIGKFDHLRERIEDPAKLDREVRKEDEQVRCCSQTALPIPYTTSSDHHLSHILEA